MEAEDLGIPEDRQALRFQRTTLFDLRASVLAAAGFSKTEAGWLLQCSRSKMLRAERRLGFAFPEPAVQMQVLRDPEATQSAIRLASSEGLLFEKIGGMKPIDAVDFLVGLLGDILWHEETHSTTPAPGLQLQPLEARVLHHLDIRRGKLCSIRNLIAALYAEVDDDARPKDTTIRVVINRIRNQLAKAGVPAEIRSVWGEGYRLIADGEVFRWHRGEA